MQPGDYHLVVHVWVMDSGGGFLITRRAPNKGYPLMWECTGGSALAGDSSLDAALREAREETGLTLSPETGSVVFTLQRGDSFCDVWLFRQNFDLGQVVLCEGETCGARRATAEEIRAMIAGGEFIAFHYADELFELAQIN